MSVFDNNLMFRGADHATYSASLTMSESYGPVRLPAGTPIRGMAVRVSVPERNASGDAIQAKVYARNHGTGSYNVIAQSEGKISIPSGGKEIIVPFSRPNADADIKLLLDVSGSDFGIVEAGVILGIGTGWDRTDTPGQYS